MERYGKCWALSGEFHHCENAKHHRDGMANAEHKPVTAVTSVCDEEEACEP